MKSDTKAGNKSSTAAEQTSGEQRRLVKSSKKPALSDQAMTRLERIRLAVLFAILAGLVVYAWRHHRWNSSIREISALLTNEDAVAAIERIRAVERDWGRSGESSFLKARAHRYLEQVELCERFLGESRVAGYSPQRLDHEQLLLDVQCTDFEVAEAAARELLTSYQADIDENGTALIRGLLRTGDTTGANIILTIWNDAQSDSARLKYVTGLTAIKLGEFEEGRKKFQESFELYPDYVPVWLELANSYWRDSEPEKAYELFDRYFQKRPDDPSAEGGRIESMLAMGNYQEVADYFKSYSKPLDTSGRGRIFLAQAYEGLEKYPELISTLEPVVKDWPQDIVANQLLAVAYQAVGQLEQATQTAERARQSVEEQTKIPNIRNALSQNYMSAELHQQLGSLLLKLISRAEGASELQIALRLDSNNKLAHEDLAHFYDVMGNTEMAEAHRKAIESTP
jgi:tetratricopeptide (TPR) repeat protein